LTIQEAQIRTQQNLHGVYGVQSGNETGFTLRTASGAVKPIPRNIYTQIPCSCHRRHIISANDSVVKDDTTHSLTSMKINYDTHPRKTHKNQSHTACLPYRTPLLYTDRYLHYTGCFRLLVREVKMDQSTVSFYKIKSFKHHYSHIKHRDVFRAFFTLKYTMLVSRICCNHLLFEIHTFCKKVLTTIDHEGPEEKYRHSSTLSLTSALDGVGG
jgi:hypothetical protein